MRTQIEWNGLNIEIEAEWEKEDFCNTDLGVQKLEGKWLPTKAGWYGINLLPGMILSDMREFTDYVNEITEKINQTEVQPC